MRFVKDHKMTSNCCNVCIKTATNPYLKIILTDYEPSIQSISPKKFQIR